MAEDEEAERCELIFYANLTLPRWEPKRKKED